MNLLHPGHGAGKGRPHIELPKLTDLAAGVPAPSGGPEPASPAVERAPDGRLTAASAAELGRRGGLAKAERERNRVQLLEGLGLHTVNPDVPALHPYLVQAEEFAAHECARLAATVGGGICGSAPASLIQTAALQLASSRYLYAQGLDLKLASTLGNDSRQNLLAAHELCAREAVARAKQPGAVDQLDAARARIMAGAK